MAILEVLRFPDPRLRQKGKAVEAVTEELEQFAKDMLETMYFYRGVGLAAVQVNRLVRLLVADTSSELTESQDEESRYQSSHLKKELVAKIKQPLILFNPEIVDQKGKALFPEGCLSFPSYFAEVKRSEIVEVRALNEKGEEIFVKTDGLLSICLQHEIDHLNGRLFIDQLSPIKARRLKEEIKKYGYPDNKESKNEVGEL